MFDPIVRRGLAPLLDRAAAVLAEIGVHPLALTAVGLAAGLGAGASAACGAWGLALGLWLANRLMDGLDGPVARRRGSTELGGFVDIVADFTVYAGFVVGVAIAEPGARLACVALLMAYYVSGTAFLSLSSLLERRGRTMDGRYDDSRYDEGRYDDGRSLRFVGGLAEGTETAVVYVLFCLLPHHAELIAWVFAAVVAVTAMQRIVIGVRLLDTAADRNPAPGKSS